MRPKQRGRGLGLVPPPGIPSMPSMPSMPSIPSMPSMPSIPIPPALPTPPTPTPSPTPTPPVVGYPYYPSPYGPYPYAPYPSYPSDLEMEFARPRRRMREEKEVVIVKEAKPKTLAQHIKEWLAGK